MQEAPQALSRGIPGQVPSEKQDDMDSMGMTPERQMEIREAFKRDLPEILEGRDRMKNVIYNGIPFKDRMANSKLKNFPADHVIHCVDRLWKLGIESLKGPRLAKEYVYPRQLTYLLLRDYCPFKSLPEIARFMHRDHTTVLHGIRVARKRLTDNPEYREKYDTIVRFIEGTPDGCDLFAEAMGDRSF